MGDFFNFEEHPGNLFVVATLLPLLSFVILLLWNGLRSYLRKYYDPEEPNFAGNLYIALDGPGKTKVGAYIATGAIFLAFCCVLVASVQFITEANDLHAHEQPETRKQVDPAKEKSHHEKEAAFAKHWKGNITWAELSAGSMPIQDPSRATSLSIGYHIDHLAVVMFLMVTFIATLIHLFSIGYMSEELHQPVEDHQVHTEDGHLKRRGRFTTFFMYLSLFCFSMLNLILADNLFQIFLSWELVGICSFLLIGFYFERTSASNAANKAFITNRVGDAGFIIGLLILWTYVGTLNFEELKNRVRMPVQDSHGKAMTGPLAGRFIRAVPAEVSAEDAARDAAKGKSFVKIVNPDDPVSLTSIALVAPAHLHAEEAIRPGDQFDVYEDGSAGYLSMPYWMLVLAGLGIFLGCVGKSAQFPLQVWLPDAMEGPTPVSALIHAATMVAAGVYLVGRAYPLFTAEVLLVIAYTGGITLFVAATIAIVQTDIKKVLAYSTVSQLGYMMLALGIGGWVAGLFHLVTHAFFKALLFLGSGSVIYGCHHEQEMTKMGGLYPKMKITALTMLMGVFAIAGMPLFSGWYSKDAIVAQAFGFAHVNPGHFLLLVLPVITAGITTFYMFRMWFMTFTGEPRDEHVYEHAHESPWVMTLPLILLAIFSIMVAWGWPVWEATESELMHHIHHAQPHSVMADFGRGHHDKLMIGTPVPHEENVSHWAHKYHITGMLVAMILVIIGFTFAAAVYWFKLLDPAEAKEQFAVAHSFLMKKYHFDELYSVMLVRPAMVVAGWCKAFDLNVIDGVIHGVARVAVWASWVGGLCDRYLVDGLANLISDVCYGVGARLRNVQTGSLRSYVLFLVLAAVGIWLLLSLLTGALTASP